MIRIEEIRIQAYFTGGEPVAILDRDGWRSPLGVKFSADDIAALEAFARGGLDVLVIAGVKHHNPRVTAHFGVVPTSPNREKLISAGYLPVERWRKQNVGHSVICTDGEALANIAADEARAKSPR